MTKRSTWALPYAIFLVLFVALPLILIMFYAFRDGSGSFTLGNFTKFFTDSCSNSWSCLNDNEFASFHSFVNSIDF